MSNTWGSSAAASGSDRLNNDDCAPYRTIDNLPVEIRVMIVKFLTCMRDLLALRAASQTWRLMMTGERGPIHALCRTLLPDGASTLLAVHPEGDLLACIIYGLLGTPQASARLVEPIQRDGTIYWVPRVNGAFCGWGLSMGAVRMSGGPRLHVWAIGRWAKGVFFDGVTRAIDLVDTVYGDTWHWRSSPSTPGCRRGMRRAQWVGRVVGGVAHGRGVWQVSNRHRCERRGSPCSVLCVGQWSKGALTSGTMTWADNHVYRGEFNNNLFHGFGVLDMGRDARYVGHWFMGQPEGNGTLCDSGPHWKDNDPSPSFYSGDWSRGWQNGMGTKEWRDGRHYIGAWANGRLHGRGSFKYADGSRHDGKWHQGERHGRGEHFHSDGHLQRRGYWVCDRPRSRLTYRHYKETGRQKSTARCMLLTMGRPLKNLSGWVNRPLITF